MKKIIAFALAAVLAAGCLAGCSGSGESGETKQDGKFKIIATIYPEYDWVSNLIKDVDGAEVEMLLDTGADLHSFQPTAEDIYRVSGCDMFVYTGGESDKWVDDVLKNAPNVTALNLMELLGDKAKEEEVVEGMQADEEEEEDEADKKHEHKEETEYDEHIWLSVKNAKFLCGQISEKLCEKDSENKQKYEANTKDYISQIDKLDTSYAEAVKGTKYDTLLFADRFPFRYLTDDYNIKYFAAFVGCSAETEASFETVKFLADKLNTLKLPAVITIDGSDKKIAETVINTSGRKDVKILTMDSMQSKTAKSVKDGETYIKLMENNLDTLKKALN